MGTVYEAKALRLNTTVALKETHFTDERLRKQFEREAQLLACLRHPALPRVIDHFDEGDGLYLVMDFIEGDDLGEMLQKRGGPYPVREVLVWADQLLEALTYMHGQDPPVIHRDIKPSNLKLTTAGQIILLDFGLAKGIGGQYSRITTSGSIFGYTPHYAPLEQIQGTGTDARSDLYSLGATVYNLSTGRVPPDVLTRVTETTDMQPDPLIPVNEMNERVPKSLADVLNKAMSVGRSQRFANAGEMRDALKNVNREIETIIALPPTILSPTPIEGDQKYSPALETTVLRENRARVTGISETQRLQLEYWTALGEQLQRHKSTVKLKEPNPNYSITGFLGHPQVELAATANTRDGRICVGVWFYNRKDIFRALEKDKEAIEREIVWRDPYKRQDFLWLENKDKSVSDIWLRWHGVNIRQRERWPEYLEWHRLKLESFYRTFEPRVRSFGTTVADGKAPWHKFVAGGSYKSAEVVEVCLEHIISGKVENPEEKLEKLQLIERSGHPLIVYSPRGEGWLNSPMNPNSWRTPTGHPIIDTGFRGDAPAGAVTIDEPVVAININKQYPHVRSAEDLYNSTRGIWRLNRERANRAKYAFSVYQGIIREVYEIEKWVPTRDETKAYWDEREREQGKYFHSEVRSGRSEFIGRLAPEDVRKKYVGKQMPVRHSQNPIRYFNC
jgi:serine/threonine protein kinase